MRCLGIESTAHTFGAAVMEDEAGGKAAASGTRNTGGVSASHEPQGGSESTDAERSVRDEEVLSSEKDMYEPDEGGIHPREAAEHHYAKSLDVYSNALRQAGIEVEELDCIAFSQGPGMPPSLDVGAVVARSLALKHNLPIYGVNHILGHIEIGRLMTDTEDPVVLYVSGGNSQVVSYAGGRYRVFGETLDIAAGNALDKLARTLGIPHPGGPEIERLAKEGEELLELSYVVKGMDFSFSGLLTEAQRMYEKGDVRKEDLCLSFQEHMYAMLVEATERAMAHLDRDEVLLTGGVAANGRLREMLETMAGERGGEAFLVPSEYATDNAAMIAWQGINRARNEEPDRISGTEIMSEWRPEEVKVTWR
ncbi:MAG: bifunctional N(6)-L-threonylcarbamoyladenine synthase/serine/threonine protein kinase [Candidatus Nanohaloarchaeota archaeon QJJ-7]|nr:bifunctional N(6)-L-threonylcarbamoyladenine synthase/serine/threonine protein kinase [Candidatus Nanohaloarchaeota archaeon QJJ-7]